MHINITSTDHSPIPRMAEFNNDDTLPHNLEEEMDWVTQCQFMIAVAMHSMSM